MEGRNSGPDCRNEKNILTFMAPHIAEVPAKNQPAKTGRAGKLGHDAQPFTQFGGRLRAQAANKLSTAIIPIFVRVPRVALPRCGARTTFSSWTNPAVSIGSRSYTSRPAPAIRFVCNALTSA